MSDTQAETEVRYTLRLPQILRDRTEALARFDRRSLNQQFVHFIETMCDQRESEAE